MKREYVDYVKDIQDSIEKIEEFNKGLSFEEFEKDIKTFFATVRAFEIIGEASSKLPSDIRCQISANNIVIFFQKIVYF